MDAQAFVDPEFASGLSGCAYYRFILQMSFCRVNRQRSRRCFMPIRLGQYTGNDEK
jgi:hypothetical protein